MTPQFLRIIECLSRGLGTREIAFELNLADKTVICYVKNIVAIFDVPANRDGRIYVALAYLRACQDELFRIGSDVIRSS